jgi:hypothetical protein
MRESHTAAVGGRTTRTIHPAANGRICPYHPACAEPGDDDEQRGDAIAPRTCARDLGSTLALVLVLPVLLVYDFLEQWALHMTERQALVGLIGPAVLAVTVIHARATLVTAGRKLVDMIKSS